MKRKIIYLVAIFAIVFIGVGCGKNDNSTESGEVEYELAEGGEITVPLAGFETLNPVMKGSQSTYYFNKLIFEGIFSVEENLEARANLAENYSISKDAKSIDIQVKEGVYFHDGSKLTAEDIEFTIDVLKKGSSEEEYADDISPLYKEGGLYDMNRIADVNVKSANNIEILFDRPFSDSPEYLTFPILSKESLKTEENALEQESYTAVGTGPYKVDSVDKLKEVDLSKNEDYRSEKPNIDKIKGKVLGDEELAKTSFEAGRIHVISDLDYLDWESYAQNDRVHISSFPSNRYEFVAFNFKNELFQGEEGKILRNALSHGVNREQILKNIYLGYGELVDSPVNPSSWLSLDRDTEEQFDIEKAKEAMKELGFEDRDGDGVLENEEGENLTLSIVAPPNSQARIDTAKSISENLRKIGIIIEEDYDAESKKYETEEERESDWGRFESKLLSGNYDLAVLGWEMSYLPDLSFAFHSESDESSNFIGYGDEKLDKLLEDANSAESRDDKKRIYGEIQKHLKEEKPYISIMYTNAAMINYKRIAGELGPNYMDIYSGIESWFVPKEFQDKEK